MSILIQYSMYLYIFLFTKPLKSSTLAADFKKNEKHINSIYHETTFSKYCYRIYLHTDRSGTKSLFQFIRTWNFQIDREDTGVKEQWFKKSLDDSINLPGSMPEKLKGDEVTVRTQWTGSLYDSSYYFNPYMENTG